jgi:hypothetical protein
MSEDSWLHTFKTSFAFQEGEAMPFQQPPATVQRLKKEETT